MKSFDVFDTLIARRYIHSDTIWSQMEREIDIPNFANHRRQCNYGTLHQIYKQLADRGVIKHHLIPVMMELEIQYEQGICFPIAETMGLVDHGDLLVSDMYIDPPNILRLVRAAGLDKQVTIHASLADKQHGTFWKAMRGHLNLEYHIGDNSHSDITLAAQEGFKTVHFTKSEPTAVEVEIEESGLMELASIVRETRLRNHEPALDKFFTIANQLNLPWLFVCCELLRRKHPNRTLVFLGRDCQLMYKIFNTYFSEASYYLPFSRRAALKNMDNAVKYIKAHVPQDYILVDISSTGRTWNKIGKSHVFDIEIIHYDRNDGEPTPSNFTWLHREEGVPGQPLNKKGTNLLLEVFNCADHGMLDNIQLVNGLPVIQFDPTHELAPDLIRVIQLPVHTAIELKKHYENLASEMSRASEQSLWYFFDKLPRSICKYQEEFRTTVLQSYYEQNKTYCNELRVLNY